MLVLVSRFSVCCAMLRIFNPLPGISWLWLLAAVVGVTFGTGLLREQLRGATSRGSVYVGMDVEGPSHWGVIVVACFESGFYFTSLLSWLLMVSLAVFPLLMVLSMETLLVFFRTRVVFADERIEISRLLKRQLLRWDGLRVDDDGSYFGLESGTKKVRFRLASTSRKRFIADLETRGVTIHVVEKRRWLPWRKR